MCLGARSGRRDNRGSAHSPRLFAARLVDPIRRLAIPEMPALTKMRQRFDLPLQSAAATRPRMPSQDGPRCPQPLRRRSPQAGAQDRLARNRTDWKGCVPLGLDSREAARQPRGVCFRSGSLVGNLSAQRAPCKDDLGRATEVVFAGLQPKLAFRVPCQLAARFRWDRRRIGTLRRHRWEAAAQRDAASPLARGATQ